MVCKECDEEVEALVTVRLSGRTVRVCQDCGDALSDSEEIITQADGTLQSMLANREPQ